MKNCFKTVMTFLACMAALSSCSQEEQVTNTMSADVTDIKEVAAHNPAEIPVTLTTNTNWIVQTPSWVKPSTVFGGGNSIVTFTVDENYVNETTNTKPRSGEIKFSGGGTIKGNGVSLVIPIAQLGYEYVDPSASIGGIHDLDEFLEFAAAAAAGQSTKKWTDDNGNVALLADIDLSSVKEWKPIGTSSNGDGLKSAPTFTNQFQGVFDGYNHKITGINWSFDASSEATNAFGLFGAIEGATIKNLIVGAEGDKISVSGTAAKPVAVSPVVGSAISSVITNVTNYVDVEFSGVEKQLGMAGIVAVATRVEVSDCANYGDMKFTVIPNQTGAGEGGNMVAGVMGYMHWGFVKNTKNYGEMVSGYGRAGGIVASINNGVTADEFATVEACINYGTIQSDPLKLGSFGNAHRHGGIVGGGEGTQNLIKDCINEGKVFSQSAARVGGIVGHSKFTITGCENRGIILGDVEGTSHGPGWLCGYHDSKDRIKQCKMGGKVGDWTTYGAAPETAPAASLDNILGYNNAGAADPAEIL